MLSKFYLILFTVILLSGSFVYFASNSSYKNSLQARVYYFLGNYESAYTLAKESYDEDNYNKMAFTVMVQSKIAKNFTAYIQEGNDYLKKIDEISSKTNFTEADRVRVKMMCQIMIDSFDDLVPTKLTDVELVENSKKMHKKFKQLFEELF